MGRSVTPGEPVGVTDELHHVVVAGGDPADGTAALSIAAKRTLSGYTYGNLGLWRLLDGRRHRNTPHRPLSSHEWRSLDDRHYPTTAQEEVSALRFGCSRRRDSYRGGPQRRPWPRREIYSRAAMAAMARSVAAPATDSAAIAGNGQTAETLISQST